MKRLVSLALAFFFSLSLATISYADNHEHTIEQSPPVPDVSLVCTVRLDQMEQFLDMSDTPSDDNFDPNDKILRTPASVGIASACLGSVCIGSGCAVSYCLGSACGSSICIGSACAVSTCGGSTCGASACVGSLCAISGCTGSVCAGAC